MKYHVSISRENLKINFQSLSLKVTYSKHKNHKASSSSDYNDLQIYLN